MHECIVHCQYDDNYYCLHGEEGIYQQFTVIEPISSLSWVQLQEAKGQTYK